MPNETTPSALGEAAVRIDDGHDNAQNNELPAQIEDQDLAYGLASAEDSRRTMEQIAHNLESSGLPRAEIDELQRTIREKGQELADRAAEEYEQAQARFTVAKEKVLGELLGVAEGKITGDAEILKLCFDPNETWDEFETKDLTAGQQQKLKQLALASLGVREPNVADYLKNAKYKEDLDRKAYGIATAADSPLGFRVAFIYRFSRASEASEDKLRDVIDDDGTVITSKMTEFRIAKIESEPSRPVEDYTYDLFL